MMHQASHAVTTHTPLKAHTGSGGGKVPASPGRSVSPTSTRLAHVGPAGGGPEGGGLLAPFLGGGALMAPGQGVFSVLSKAMPFLQADICARAPPLPSHTPAPAKCLTHAAPPRYQTKTTQASRSTLRFRACQRSK